MEVSINRLDEDDKMSILNTEGVKKASVSRPCPCPRQSPRPRAYQPSFVRDPYRASRWNHSKRHERTWVECPLRGCDFKYQWNDKIVSLLPTLENGKPDFHCKWNETTCGYKKALKSDGTRRWKSNPLKGPKRSILSHHANFFSLYDSKHLDVTTVTDDVLMAHRELPLCAKVRKQSSIYKIEKGSSNLTTDPGKISSNNSDGDYSKLNTINHSTDNPTQIIQVPTRDTSFQGLLTGIYSPIVPNLSQYSDSTAMFLASSITNATQAEAITQYLKIEKMHALEVLSKSIEENRLLVERELRLSMQFNVSEDQNQTHRLHETATLLYPNIFSPMTGMNEGRNIGELIQRSLAYPFDFPQK